MKFNHWEERDNSGRVIQAFGEAKLVRRPDGKHELLGGTADDIAAASDWVSLIAHEVVFSRTLRKRVGTNPPAGPRLAFRFHSRLPARS